MPDIQPLRAVRYDADSLDMVKIVSPPYDVISSALQNDLYRRHSFNAVRLELPKEEEGYLHAAERFRRWQEQKILIQDDENAIYPYQQTFTNAQGASVTRRGFFCLLRLEEFSEGNVLPHEKTLTAPKEDRLKILRAVRANLSPIFGLYAGAPAGLVANLEETSEVVLADIIDEHGERNVLRRCSDRKSIDFARAGLHGAKIYIADGHHRYETAIAYRDEMRLTFPGSPENAPWEYILIYLSDINDPALEIQPTHRLVHSIQGFEMKIFEDKLNGIFNLYYYDSLESGVQKLREAGSDTLLFTYPGTSRVALATLRSDINKDTLFGASVPQVLRELSVEILHVLVLRNILGLTEELQMKKINLEYVHTLKETKEALVAGRIQFAVVLNPTTLLQLQQAAGAGVVLPQKSTYFYPKLLSGLVFHSFE